MAAVGTKKNQQTPPAAATPFVDPKFEWTEKAGSYVLCLALPGFRKDDFRVQVDGAGRLTVRGAMPSATGPGSSCKAFQLPATASLDDITGRFEAGMLTLTVPKRAAGAGDGAAAPTSIEEIKRKQPSVAKEEGVTGGVKKTEAKEEIGKEDTASKKTMDEVTENAQQQKQHEEEAKLPMLGLPEGSPSSSSSQLARTKQEQQKPAPTTAKKEEDVKPKAPQAAAAAPPMKPEAASGGDMPPKAVIAPESLAERVGRWRGEEERGNAAPMAAAKRAITDGERKPTAACGGSKERVQEELKVLTDMKWADGVMEAARKNKEVVAVGVAAFTLGFFVSQRIFRK